MQPSVCVVLSLERERLRVVGCCSQRALLEALVNACVQPSLPSFFRFVSENKESIFGIISDAEDEEVFVRDPAAAAEPPDEDVRPAPIRCSRKRKCYEEHRRANAPGRADAAGPAAAVAPLPAAPAPVPAAPAPVPAPALAAVVAAPADPGAAAGLEARFAQFTPVCVVDGSRCLARTWGGGQGGQCRSKPCGEDGLCKVHHRCHSHGLVPGEIPIPPAKLAEFEA